MNIEYCINKIERNLGIMENILNSHKTIPELAHSPDFHGADMNVSTFVNNALHLGGDISNYYEKYEILVRRYIKLTEKYYENQVDIQRIGKSLFDIDDEEYMPKVISTKSLGLRRQGLR